MHNSAPDRVNAVPSLRATKAILQTYQREASDFRRFRGNSFDRNPDGRQDSCRNPGTYIFDGCTCKSGWVWGEGFAMARVAQQGNRLSSSMVQ